MLFELDGFNRMKAMMDKLVHFRLHRPKLVSELDIVEVNLLKYLEGCCVKEKIGTRNIIFLEVA